MMKGHIFFILLVGAQIIASLPNELPIKDTEVKRENSRQRRDYGSSHVNLIPYPEEGEEGEESEHREMSEGREMLEGREMSEGRHGKKKRGLDLDLGVDLGLPEEVASNADIDIGLRINTGHDAKEAADRVDLYGGNSPLGATSVLGIENCTDGLLCSGACDCDYHHGGCTISSPAPSGWKCVCTYKGGWTCGGWAQQCNANEYCPADDYSYCGCMRGGGDCGGYKHKPSC